MLCVVLFLPDFKILKRLAHLLLGFQSTQSVNMEIYKLFDYVDEPQSNYYEGKSIGIGDILISGE